MTKLITPWLVAIASSYNRLNAISSSYPDKQIDLAKVLFSQGKMPLTANVHVSIVEKGLTFKWDASFTVKGIHQNDQVMLMAYDPDKAEYEISAECWQEK
ncbi:DUF6266 family protein [Pedobacter cryoconitis]|uniref:Uncharacterized protein n=1 Tax=Pedobacter cryoconitis TaxID=188932 RepID=A0A327SJG0_9SPHI|nr:DUF6266 family protein [Pedobacter cryoconitis]RAJ28622.1 hypothetical protein LY11_03278 [Pedobacter cryoconitis]